MRGQTGPEQPARPVLRGRGRCMMHARQRRHSAARRTTRAPHDAGAHATGHSAACGAHACASGRRSSGEASGSSSGGAGERALPGVPQCRSAASSCARAPHRQRL